MSRILTAFLAFSSGCITAHSQKGSLTKDSYDWKGIELKLNEFNLYDDSNNESTSIINPITLSIFMMKLPPEVKPENELLQAHELSFRTK